MQSGLCRVSVESQDEPGRWSLHLGLLGWLDDLNVSKLVQPLEAEAQRLIKVFLTFQHVGHCRQKLAVTV